MVDRQTFDRVEHNLENQLSTITDKQTINSRKRNEHATSKCFRLLLLRQLKFVAENWPAVRSRRVNVVGNCSHSSTNPRSQMLLYATLRSVQMLVNSAAFKFLHRPQPMSWLTKCSFSDVGKRNRKPLMADLYFSVISIWSCWFVCALWLGVTTCLRLCAKNELLVGVVVRSFGRCACCCAKTEEEEGLSTVLLY